MSEQEELRLLERVFLRLGSADTDEQLETTLSKFLAPVLLKLDCQVDGVRKKVMELLVHVNKRVKTRPVVKLPIAELIDQYLDKNVSPFVSNFTILYIKLGFPREAPSKQCELLPLLVCALHGSRPEPQQNCLLQLITNGIQYLRVPSTDAEKKESHWSSLTSADPPTVQTLLLSYWLDILLLPYNFHGRGETVATVQSQGGVAASAVVGGGASSRPASSGSTATPSSSEPPPPPPSGLSDWALKRVTGENPPSPDDLEKIKMSVLQLLGSGVFKEHLVVAHLVIGTADTRHSVASLAELKLKQMIGGDDWNTASIISQLYSIFLGTVAVKGQPTVKPEMKRVAANVGQRLKIFPYLLKSREAANQFPACIQIVFDCLYTTNTNARLKILAVQFVHHLSLFESQFAPIAPVLLSGMLKLIGESKEDEKLRCLSYVAVGRIVSRQPSLVTKDTSLVQSLFNSIITEVGDNKTAVQETLSLICGALTDLKDETKLKQIEALVLHNIEESDDVSRLMAVQFARTVFPSDHVPTRYALLLACGDNKELIHTEASKAISAPPTADTSSLSSATESSSAEETGESEAKRPCPQAGRPALMPSFVDMVNYIHEKAVERVKGPQKHVIGNTVLPFKPTSYIEMLSYLRCCLAYASTGGASLSSVESVAAMKLESPLISKYVNRLLSSITPISVPTQGELKSGAGGWSGAEEMGPIGVYVNIIRQLLTALNGAPAMFCLLEIVAVARGHLSPYFSKHASWIKGFVFSHKDDMSEYAAELYAIICVDSCSPVRLIEIIKELTTNVSNGQTVALETRRGSILCLGFLLANILSKQRSASSSSAERMDTGSPPPSSSSQPYSDKDLVTVMATATIQLLAVIDSATLSLALAACTALGEIGRSGALPLNDTEKGGVVVVGGIKEGGGGASKQGLVDKLISKVKSQKEDNKIREKSAQCVGLLCVGEANFAFRQQVIEGLLDCAAAKQFELHCTVGDALVCAAQGSQCSAARDIWTVVETEYRGEREKEGEVGVLLNLLLEKYLKSPNPHIRQAACIWLVTLVKECGHYSAVQSQIINIQASFIGLLGESDDLTQDVVSKGLGVVYEKGSAEQKRELVAALVETLTGTGQRNKLTVTDDTQVFQDGAIGKTPDGQSMSTYKELCSIANDLNQPDLIYKFMHLANHNAAWNAKRGAAYGFSMIASQAGDQLSPHLNKIVPKMYRYQFDPNPRIQQAMLSIWNSLVTDTQNTVSKYIREIVEDLLKNLTSNQWRVRESSCLALNDLLRGRPLDDIIDSLPQLWETCFRVRDDIKESSRNAAELALKTLSRASIKLCDPSSGKIGEHATAIILPCLLSSGISSPVPEVRSLSLTTIMKIGKTAGVLLKPHIPLLTVALLESITTLEPQMLNYLSLHTASSRATQDRLDSARLAAYKTSPMMEAVNLCVQYVDSAVLVELVPRLIDVLRSGVGLGTKVCCASFIISITRQAPVDVALYSGKLMAALLSGLSGDRNATVRKSYASALGHVVKVSKESSVEKLLTRVSQWYLEKEDESVKQSCGAVVQAVNLHSPDVLKAHASLVLPLVFLAMHDKPEKESSSDDQPQQEEHEIWEEIWQEVTPGTEAGVRLYLNEIIAMTQSALKTSQSWTVKRQAALAMKTLADKQGSNINAQQLGSLLSALITGLAGRTWTGKESLLEALSAVCLSSKELLALDRVTSANGDVDVAPSSVADVGASVMEVTSSVDAPPSLSDVVDALFRECRKESVPRYQLQALRSTANILDAFELDRFTDIADIAYPIIRKTATKDEDDDKTSVSTKLDMSDCALDVIGRCWPTNQRTQSLCQQELLTVLCDSLGKSSWKQDVVIYKAIKNVLNRLCALKDSQSVTDNETFLSSVFSRLLPAVCTALPTTKSSSLRSEMLAVVNVAVTRLSVCGRLDMLSMQQLSQLQEILKDMSRNDTQAELQDKASQINTVLENGLKTVQA